LSHFLFVFGVTFLVIAITTAALVFGKSAVYQPSVADIESILNRLLEGSLPAHEWDFFIDMPIRHNKELEIVRLKCAQANEQNWRSPKANMVRLKEPGLIVIRHIVLKFEDKGTKSF